MKAHRIASFSQGPEGGNPAGVVLEDRLPNSDDMQALAAQVGFSETVFAAPQIPQDTGHAAKSEGAADTQGGGPRSAPPRTWNVRYYSPEAEVAFCGHATIALGVQLGKTFGAGRYDLQLARDRISVTANATQTGWRASLQSPKTWSRPLAPAMLEALLDMFNLAPRDLDPRLAPTLGFAGNRHAIVTLKSRERLAGMAYDFEVLKAFMKRHDLTTVSLLYVRDDATFVARNAFAIGGVVEDPATGAAAAALAGSLVDIGWPGLAGGGRFTILQGEDMGAPSVLEVTVTGVPGDPVCVGGGAREMG